MKGQTVLHYTILDQLGAGGMGVVYRATDTRLDRTVALKFLPEAASSDGEAKRRLILEAKGAAKLDHPNIGVIHSIEEFDERLFIVMALYEGKSLKDLLADGPLDVGSAVDIALQSARGLAQAHKSGIIHRDIKPANLLLTDDGLVKILDFGLVKLDELDGLTTTGAILGTPEYMAPEQVRGQEIDHRVDLWALGVVLYEMLTGISPFKAGGLPATIMRVMTEQPDPILAHRSDLPEEIQPVLERSLAKEPDERYSAAPDLIADLESLLPAGASGRSAAASVRLPESRAPSAPATGSLGPQSVEQLITERTGVSTGHPYLEPVPRVQTFVGREEELMRLRERLAQDRMVIIKGMAGMGKSALGARLARDTAAEDKIFWYTFDPVEKHTADALFWSLAAFFNSRGDDLLWRYLQGEVESNQPLDRTVKLNLLLSSLFAGDYLLCFDDFHLVSGVPEIAELFKALQRQVSQRRQELDTHIVVMGRELPHEMEYLAGETLRGFSQVEAKSLIEARNLNLPPALAQRLWERTQGNTMLLELAIAALTRMAGDEEAMEAFIESMAGKGDIRDYILTHVYQSLQGDEKSVVEALSIFTSPVDLETAEETLASDDVSGIALCIDALAKKSIVSESEDGRIYCHDLVREFCYRALDRKQRRRLHGCAAAFFEDKKNFLSAAYHYFEQGDQAKALELLTANQEAIIHGGGAGALLEQLSRFVASSLEPDQQLQLVLAKGRTLDVRGDYREAISLYEEALDDVFEDEERAELLCRIGSTFDAMGDYEQAVEYSKQGLQLYEELGDDTGIAQAQKVIGWGNYRAARFEDARQSFNASRDIAQTQGDKRVFAKANLGLGGVEFSEGNLEQAKKRFDESRRIFKELRDRLGEAQSLANLASVYLLTGNSERALSLSLKASESFMAIGDVRNLLILYNNLGDMYRRSGHNREAIENYEKLGQLAGRVGHVMWLSSAQAGMAETALASGDLAAAQAHAHEAFQIVQDIGSSATVEKGVSSRIQGEVFLAQGDYDKARLWLERSMPLLDEAREDEELEKARLAHERVKSLMEEEMAATGSKHE